MIKDFIEKNNIEYISDVSLKEYNTYHIDSKAMGMVFPKSIDELVNLIKILKESNIEYVFLGNGSNIILKDEYYDKIFIKLDKLNNYKIEDNIVTVEAGVPLIRLSLDCARLGLSGLEFMCALPGHMGSSVAMNAGAYNQSISDVLVSAKILTKDLEVKEFTNKDLEFKYRDSFLKHNRDYICLEATLKLEYGNANEIYEVMAKRQSKRIESQPLEYPCAGSVFRNPDGLYAGELIEKCELKGTNINGAEVSVKHANFIINKGNAKGKDILELIEIIKKKVYDKYSIELVLEQEII